MKKLFVVVAAVTIMAGATSAMAGFFDFLNPEDKDLTILKFTDDIKAKIDPITGVLTLTRDNFKPLAGDPYLVGQKAGVRKVYPLVYDPKTKLAAVVLGRTTPGQYDQGLVLIKDKITTDQLDNLVQNAPAWTKYLESGSCIDEASLAKSIGLPVPAKSILAENPVCSALKEPVADIIAKAVTPGRKSIDGYLLTGTSIDPQKADVIGASWRYKNKSLLYEAIQKYAGIPTFTESAKTNTKLLIGLRDKGQFSAVADVIASLTKDFPKDSEQLVWLSRMSKQCVSTNYQTGGCNKFADIDDGKWNWAPDGLTANVTFARWVGWTAFNDDTLIERLRMFDYPFKNPKIEPDYENGLVNRCRVTFPRVKLPFAAYLICAEKLAQPKAERGNPINIETPEGYTVTDSNGLLLYAVPGIDPTPDSYKTAWRTWHTLLQQITPDEIRKLAVFPTTVTGRGYPKTADNGYTYPMAHEGILLPHRVHPLGGLIVEALGTTSPAALNTPTFWLEAERGSSYQGENQPGYTLNRFLSLMFKNNSTAPDANGQTFLKALFTGNTDDCKKALHAGVTDKALTDQQKATVEAPKAAAKMAHAVYDRRQYRWVGSAVEVTSHTSKQYGDDVCKIFPAGTVGSGKCEKTQADLIKSFKSSPLPVFKHLAELLDDKKDDEDQIQKKASAEDDDDPPLKTVKKARKARIDVSDDDGQGKVAADDDDKPVKKAKKARASR